MTVQANLESSIYAFEGSYLSDQLLGPSSTGPSQTNSSQFGNIIKGEPNPWLHNQQVRNIADRVMYERAGYDAYLKAPPQGADRKRGRGGDETKDSDRMFSRSSATYQKVRNTILMDNLHVG